MSFPQCVVRGTEPRAAAFSVVGVNGGRAFSLNPCFDAQWRAAPGTRSIYLNSGFFLANAPKVVDACRRRAERAAVPSGDRLAYELGCSTARDTLDALRTVGARPDMWWIDVESSNSWSENDADENRASIRGELEELAATDRPVGVYSSFSDWRAVTGGWDAGGVVADWVGGMNPVEACSHPGFSGAPVWLAQELALWPGPPGFDSDYAC